MLRALGHPTSAFGAIHSNILSRVSAGSSSASSSSAPAIKDASPNVYATLRDQLAQLVEQKERAELMGDEIRAEVLGHSIADLQREIAKQDEPPPKAAKLKAKIEDVTQEMRDAQRRGDKRRAEDLRVFLEELEDRYRTALAKKM
jgi:hypothetical protein